MKKLFLLCAAAVSLAVNAEVITLDLATAFDVAGNPIVYETKDMPVFNGNLQNVWDSTYSEDWSAQMIYCNGNGIFTFTHLPSGASYGGSSWEGFTLSKATDEGGANQFACLAKGGLKGEGTPYLIGYYSEYYTWTNADDMPSSNIIFFKEEYYPTQMFVCQNNNTYDALIGNNSMANKFTKNDTLTLIVSSLNNLYEEIASVEYYLAVDSVFNKDWAKIDLTPLGQCMGLSIRMTSTDTSYGFSNTPCYFAMDGLQVSTENPFTAMEQTEYQQNNATKRIINGQLYIEQNGVLYTLTGIKL